jgi:hypothetical protein
MSGSLGQYVMVRGSLSSSGVRAELSNPNLNFLESAQRANHDFGCAVDSVRFIDIDSLIGSSTPFESYRARTIGFVGRIGEGELALFPTRSLAEAGVRSFGARIGSCSNNNRASCRIFDSYVGHAVFVETTVAMPSAHASSPVNLLRVVLLDNFDE